MSEAESQTGTCDLCGKEADGTIEECVNIFCIKGCHREGGDVYHADCIKKYIGTSARANSAKQPKIPYSNFLCPKGKSNKTSATEPCKGMVQHCRRIHYKNENKVVPPPPLQVINPPVERKRKKDKPKSAGGAGPSNATAATDADGWETVGAKKPPQCPPKPPVYRNNPGPAAVKLPPIPQAPKPDPLGRKLSSEKAIELPVGFVPEDDGGGAKGKSAKKNQKRAAKRKADCCNMAGSQGKASGSNLSGWGEGFGSEAASDADGSDYQALMGNAKFITNVDVFNRLLAGEVSESGSQAGSPDDEDALAITTEEEHEDAYPEWGPDFTLREGVEWPVVVGQEMEDDGDPDGWQTVLPGGKASAPVGPLATGGDGINTLPTATAHSAPDEDAELRAALEASAAAANDAANNVVVGAPDDESEFEQQLARAMAESQRAEQERLHMEKAAQAALLARFEEEQRRQQQQQQQQQPQLQPQHQQQGYANPRWQDGAYMSGTPILSYNQAPQSIASTVTLPAAAPAPTPMATSVGVAAPITAQPFTFSQPAVVSSNVHQPYQLHQRQPPLAPSFQHPTPLSNGVASMTFSYQQQPLAPAAPLPLPQQQPLAPAAPLPLPLQQPLQQHVSSATWQRHPSLPFSNGGLSSKATGLVAPQKFAMLSTAPPMATLPPVDDDDTEELLALLTAA